MRVRFVVGGVAAAALLLIAAGTGAAAQSSSNAAVQKARDAARAGEALHVAKVTAATAARQAAAATALAQKTHRFGDVAAAKAATAKAARLGAAAARAQLAVNARTSKVQAFDVDNQVPSGSEVGTTTGTVKIAQNRATNLCKTSAIEEAKRAALAARVLTAVKPAEKAKLQAKLDKQTPIAAAALAACTAATDYAAKEAASFAGLSDGTAVEGTPSVTEADPFPDNLETCATPAGVPESCHSSNVQLVGHARGAFSTTGSVTTCPAFNTTKCPGFSAINFVTGYKSLGYDFLVGNGTSGLSVFSLKDPAHPQYISTIPFTALVAGLSGAAASQFWEGENMTVDSARKLVFLSRDIGNKGLFIISLKDPWHPELLGFQKVFQGHTATCLNGCRYIWSVGGVQSGGAGFTGKSSPVSATDIRDPAHPFTFTTGIGANVSRLATTGGSTHGVDVDFNGVAWVSASNGVRGFWTSGKHWDSVSNTMKWATPFAPLSYGGGRVTGNTTTFMHNAYHFPGTLAGRPKGDVLLMTNEANSRTCSNAGLFIISSLTNTLDDHGLVVTPPNTVPQMDRLGTFTVNNQPGQFHDTRGTTTTGDDFGDCSSHWFTVRGNIVAAGFYEQGLRLIDISNPAAPVQVGYGRVPARAAVAGGPPAIISSNVAGQYWYGKYIYTSDYARGVDVWKYTGPIPGVIEKKTCWNSCEK